MFLNLGFRIFVFHKNVVSTALSKVEALKNKESPRMQQSLIGMTQYSAQLIPNFSEPSAPLIEFIIAGVPCYWEKADEKAYNKLDNILTSEQVLIFFSS